MNLNFSFQNIENYWLHTWIKGLSLKFEDTTTTLKWVSEPRQIQKNNDQ